MEMLPTEINNIILNKCSLVNLIALGRVHRNFKPWIHSAIEKCFQNISKSDYCEIKKKLSVLNVQRFDETLSLQKNQTLFQILLMVHLSAAPYLWTTRIEPHLTQKQILKFDQHLSAKSLFESNWATFSVSSITSEKKLALAYDAIKKKIEVITSKWLKAMQIRVAPADFDNKKHLGEIKLADSSGLFYKGMWYLRYGMDPERGLSLICTAGHCNFAPALHQLAGLSVSGEHVPQNIPKAVLLYEKAIALGHLPSMLNLGYLYIFGKTVEKDEPAGYSLVKKAAEGGLTEAQYMLGQCYQHGIHVKRNLVSALKWFHLAAKNGDVFAKAELGLIYSNENYAVYNPQKGFKWCLRAAHKGIEISQVYVGVCYFNGWGTEQDLVKAFNWTKKAAEAQQQIAQNNLAVFYELGLGTEVNISEALRYYRKAADKGSEQALLNLINLVSRLSLEGYEI